ncbi:MAG: hypothetical protein LBE25_03585 [Arthrobacter sp.]|jgi:hypothetical protein|nr:hypothetical protein [Arthrobacter sp.]
MQKKKLAALAAPMTILALSLAACGSGSTPGASSTSDAPASTSQSAPAEASTTEASTTEDAAATSDTAATDAMIGDDTLGDADVDAAAKAFKSKWTGATVVGSKSGAFKMMTAASAIMEQASIEPAVCKTLALESVKALPEDGKIAVVVNTQGATTPGAVSSISFMSLEDSDYFKVANESATQQASKCKDMTMEVAGQKITSSTETFTPSGVNADLVTGAITTQTVSGVTTSTVAVTASRGNVGVSAQATTDSDEARANLVEAVNAGFDALAGQ